MRNPGYELTEGSGPALPSAGQLGFLPTPKKDALEVPGEGVGTGGGRGSTVQGVNT